MGNTNTEKKGRGRPPKYDFDLKVGESRTYQDTTTANVGNSAKSYAKRRNLDWTFACTTIEGGGVTVTRTK